MNSVRIEKTIETDGELHLSDLPYHRGDKVDVVVHILTPHSETDERESERAAAIAELLAMGRASTFRSNGPYPTRDELHERS